MASHPILTVLEEAQVSPPPATLSDRTLPLTCFDITWLRAPPVHHLFFYEFPITKSEFLKTIVPNLKNSLSITLQHFFPFVGNLIVFPSPDKKPEIRYVKGNSIVVTFTECNLDFNNLTGNHPRDCDKFYHLIPLLGQGTKISDYIKIPVFSVQVSFFPNQGISIGMTNHHSLGDASTRFCFLKAWASIARSGTDKSFLANGTMPFYDRVFKYPKLDDIYLKRAKVDTQTEGYQPPRLYGPTNRCRATFILTRHVINNFKKFVLNKLPTLAYVSSFTIACGYIWSCIAKLRKDELQLFGFPINLRTRMDPPVPEAYFGNCVGGCVTVAKTALLMGSDGIVNAAKLLGESLHKTLTDKDGVVKDIWSFEDLFSEGMPTTFIGVAGTPKLKFYDLDFGWGKPKKHETISIDYNGSISVNACKESNEDLEIGVCLSVTEMEAFIVIFEDGLKAFI